VRWVAFWALLLSNLWGYERIIALSPAINEIIYALGAEGKIIANSEFCDYPIEAKIKPKVGGYLTPNLETILTLAPDLVITQSDNTKLKSQLDRLAIPVKTVEITNLASIKNAILDIGTIVQEEQKAQKIVTTIDQKIKSLHGITTNQKILIVIGEYLTIKSRIFVAGQNLYFDDIIKASGNRNAFESNRIGQPILSRENIIALNPDIIIILAPMQKEKNLTDMQLITPWLTLPINAAKNKAIAIISQNYAGVPSDRLVYFLEDMRGILEEYQDK